MSSPNASLSVPERKRWTQEEDRILHEQLKKHSNGVSVDWRKVSEPLSPRRTNKDCRKRWLKIDSAWQSGQWRAIEDIELKNAIAIHGFKWKAVSDEMGTRNPDQCAKRWRNALDPNLIRGKWTDEDDRLLEHAITEHGGRREWKDIAPRYFPGRSRLDLSNRYTMLQRKKRLVHRRDLSNVTNSSLATDCSIGLSRASSDSPGVDFPSCAISPLSVPETETLPSSMELKWNGSTACQSPATSTSNAIHNDFGILQSEDNLLVGADHSTPHIKLENWSDPIPMTESHPPTYLLHQLGVLDSYTQYPQWSSEWGSSKEETATGSAGSIESLYPPNQSVNHSVNPHHHILGQKSSQQCAIALDLRNENDSALLDALRKNKSIGTLTVLVHDLPSL